MLVSARAVARQQLNVGSVLRSFCNATAVDPPSTSAAEPVPGTSQLIADENVSKKEDVPRDIREERPMDTYLVREIFNRHDSTFDPLEQSVVKGKVLKLNKRRAVIDIGFRKFIPYPTDKLSVLRLVSALDKEPRSSYSDVRVGDALHFRVGELRSAFRDASVTLELYKRQDDDRAVWEEFKQYFEDKTPLRGRVLNSINGGFAVGVGGRVLFCPFSMCSLSTASRIGVLQEFVIHDLGEDIRSMVIMDKKMHESLERRNLQRQAARQQMLPLRQF